MHINRILVGSQSFSGADKQKIDRAIQFTRDAYAQGTVRIAIGRVERWALSEDEAQVFGVFGGAASEDEADDVRSSVFLPNDGIDLFFFKNFTDTDTLAGRSVIDGGCKTLPPYPGGAMVVIDRPADKIGRTLAHELGHYLGLHHRSDPFNLMTQSGDAVKPPIKSIKLESDQGAGVRDHCLVHASCP